jgi:hypothetical protein
MSFGSIYKIPFPNEKHYLGLTTTSLEQRRKEHKKCAQSGDARCLYNALRKNDMVETFELIEVDTANTLEELCEKEIRYITEYNSYYMNGNGYNMTYGGEGTNGYVFTDEDKEKMSSAQKIFHENNPQARYVQSDKIREWNIKNPHYSITKSNEMKEWHDNNPDFKETHSKFMKNLYIENPNLREFGRERMKKRYEDNPNLRREYGENMQNYWIDNPDKLKIRNANHSTLMQELVNTPQYIEKLLDAARILNTIPEFNVYDKKTGSLVGTFDYIPDAEDCLFDGKKNTHIGECLKKLRKSTQGYIFKYVD